MTPTLLSVLAAFVLPAAITYLTLRFAPRGPDRAFSSLVGLSLVGAVTAIALEYVLTSALPSNAQQGTPVTFSLLAIAGPEQGSKVGALLIWLSFLTKRSMRDAVVGSVLGAMVFDIAGGGFLFAAAAHADLTTWIQKVVTYWLISTLPSAVNAAIVGIWIATSLDKSRVDSSPTVIGAIFVVVTTNALWSLAMIILSNHWTESDLWFRVLAGRLPLILITIAIQVAAIAFGLSRNPRFALP